MITLGTVYIVGAGPGDPDLITIRGAQLLAAADTVIITGSLVPRTLLKHCTKNPAVIDSKGLTLEEIMAKTVAAARAGQVVVRLHTGEPSIFGATMEQIDELRKEKIPFVIVPGISSFQAAAAALEAEFTIPDVSQTLIISRAGGKTPVPEREELAELAKIRATVVLYLSAALAEKIERDLLTQYPSDEPIAIVRRVSWPDELIVRGELKNLVALTKEHAIKDHALIIVGPGLKSHGTKSKLYDATFSHRFRKAKVAEPS